MQLFIDFCRATLRVLPQARPPSPAVGTALAKQLEPRAGVAYRALPVLVEQPAVSARLRASRVGRAQDMSGRIGFLHM
ncbi:hypothetical protein V520_14015 [Pseudomonas putida KG-4]|nr:hypothetical protein V520_14015 [Pseudomonas putida KG-4]